MWICCQWSFYTHGTGPTTDLRNLNNLPIAIRQSQLSPVLFGLKCAETRGLRCRWYFYNTQLRLYTLGPGGAGTHGDNEGHKCGGRSPTTIGLEWALKSPALWAVLRHPLGRMLGPCRWAARSKLLGRDSGGPSHNTHGTKFSPRASQASDPQSQILTSILLPTKTKAFSWLKSPECNKENYFPKNLSQKTSPNI